MVETRNDADKNTSLWPAGAKGLLLDCLFFPLVGLDEKPAREKGSRFFQLLIVPVFDSRSSITNYIERLASETALIRHTSRVVIAIAMSRDIKISTRFLGAQATETVIQ